MMFIDSFRDAARAVRAFARVLGPVVVACAAVGCAKVGDPLPPIPQYPSTIGDLRAARAPSGVELFFSVPSTDTRWIEIHRQCDPKTAGDRIQLIARLALDELRDSGQPGVFAWEDRAADSRRDCRYALRFVNERGLQSEFSNFASPH